MTFLPDIDLPPFVVGVLKLAVSVALIAAVLVPLERLYAIRPQPILRRQVATDLAYCFINSLLPGIVLGVPLSLIAMCGRELIPLHALAAIAALPIWVKMLVALVVGEVGFYWGHRWSHEWPVLWRFHAVHHSAEQVDFLTNTRAHPVDMVFTKFCGLFPLYAVGLSNPALALSDSALFVVLAHFIGGWGFFIHSNLRWRLGPLEGVLSTPAFHHWHHTRSDHRDRNYASFLPVMDRIFGTYYLPKHDWPAEYGITGPMPHSLSGQLAYPWRDEEDQETDGTAR
jgi:sterol desaturase/sphingolipid hydroxylase (fatty acid hydroxylase superfamily)